MRPAAVMAALLAAALCGCGQDSYPENARLRAELLDSRAQVEQLQRQNSQLDQRLQQAQQQVQALQQMGPQRLELVPHAAAIRLGRYTSAIHTAGGQGPDDAVKVYVQPLDAQGQAVKAAGTLKVELFDLSAPPDQNLLGRCELSAPELANHWYSGFGANHYSLVCPFDRTVQHPRITVAATFVDLVSGRTYQQQTVVEARGAASQPAASQSAPAGP